MFSFSKNVEKWLFFRAATVWLGKSNLTSPYGRPRTIWGLWVRSTVILKDHTCSLDIDIVSESTSNRLEEKAQDLLGDLTFSWCKPLALIKCSSDAISIGGKPIHLTYYNIFNVYETFILFHISTRIPYTSEKSVKEVKKRKKHFLINQRAQQYTFILRAFVTNFIRFNIKIILSYNITEMYFISLKINYNNFP